MATRFIGNPMRKKVANRKLALAAKYIRRTVSQETPESGLNKIARRVGQLNVREREKQKLLVGMFRQYAAGKKNVKK